MTPELATHSTGTLGTLREAFLADNGFVDKPPMIDWVKVGPVPVPVPNPPARHRALRLHDLHHLLTGYSTEWTGEGQISAWECAAGLNRNWIAWVFCPMGTFLGMIVCPRDTVRAYARGRIGRTLLGQDPQAVMNMTPDEGRRFCGLDHPPPEPTAGDWMRTIGWALFGTVSATLPPLAWLASKFDRGPDVLIGEA